MPGDLENAQRVRARRVEEALLDIGLLSVEADAGHQGVTLRLDRPDADRLCEIVREGR